MYSLKDFDFERAVWTRYDRDLTYHLTYEYGDTQRLFACGVLKDSPDSHLSVSIDSLGYGDQACEVCLDNQRRMLPKPRKFEFEKGVWTRFNENHQFHFTHEFGGSEKLSICGWLMDNVNSECRSTVRPSQEKVCSNCYKLVSQEGRVEDKYKNFMDLNINEWQAYVAEIERNQ